MTGPTSLAAAELDPLLPSLGLPELAVLLVPVLFALVLIVVGATLWLQARRHDPSSVGGE